TPAPGRPRVPSCRPETAAEVRTTCTVPWSVEWKQPPLLVRLVLILRLDHKGSVLLRSVLTFQNLRTLPVDQTHHPVLDLLHEPLLIGGTCAGEQGGTWLGLGVLWYFQDLVTAHTHDLDMAVVDGAEPPLLVLLVVAVPQVDVRTVLGGSAGDVEDTVALGILKDIGHFEVDPRGQSFLLLLFLVLLRGRLDRKSTRLNSSHVSISYAV